MSGTRWQDDYREQVERMLERLLPSERDELFAGVIDAMRYSLLGGGKRIRPLLLLEFCRLWRPGKGASLGLCARNDSLLFADSRRSPVYG